MEVEDKTRKETKGICRVASLHTITPRLKDTLQQEGNSAKSMK